MKFFLIGLAAGVLIGFLPLLEPAGGMVFHPEWYGDLASLDRIELSPRRELAQVILPPVLVQGGVSRLNARGELLNTFAGGEKLIAVSGSGEFVAGYEKVGRSVEFFGIKGDRFWKIRSMEYPHLSHNGRLVLMLNGDQSRIRLIDFNGNETGARSIPGRFCTVIAFARGSDFAAAGFLDGSYYLVNGDGAIVLRDRLPDGAPVKSLALSGNGLFLAVHYGGAKGDFVRLCNVARKDSEELKLKSVHLTRIPLFVNDDGRFALIDRDRFVVADRDCDVDLDLRVPEQRAGHASIDYAGGLYAVAYSVEKGGSRFVLLRKSGTVIFTRAIVEEPFLDCRMTGGCIMLRGAKSLYCYSYRDPASR